MFFALYASRHVLVEKIPEILLLAALLSAALRFQVFLPRSNTQINFLHPFYALSVLMLDKLAILPCFLAWLVWVLKTYKEEGKNALSLSFAVWTPASEAPMALAASYAFHGLGGHTFTTLREVPWLAFCGLVFSWVGLDAIIHNTFSGIVHGVAPWRILFSDLIGYFDVPLTPLTIPVYIVYSAGGIKAFLFLSIPIVTVLWLTRRFFEEAARREESTGHLDVAGELIRSTLDMDDLIRSVAERVKEVMGADAIELYLLENGEWGLKAVLGKSPWAGSSPSSEFLQALDSFAGRHPLNIQDLSKEPHFCAHARSGLQSALVIPLYFREETLGCIVCSKEMLYYFYAYHEGFARALTGQVSQAIVSAKLHARLARTLEELRATQEELIQSEKMAGIGKLAAGVAHEINNPLGAIVINAESMMKEIGEARPLLIILNAAQKAKSIVESLLPFSRQARGSGVVFQIGKVVRESLEMWEKQLERAGVRVVADLVEDPEIYGKPEELIQVISNLIANAKDALLEKNPPEKLIRITARRTAEAAMLEVADNGCGIPSQNISKIFEPFFTTKEIGKGTGLGLSVSYAMVSAMGGKIEVRSEPGERTVFLLIFPVPKHGQANVSLIDQALENF